MKPSVKYAVIYRHRTEYPVTVMCNFFAVSRSGYYSFVNRLGKPIKDAELEWSRKAHTQITLSGDLTPLLCPPQTLNKRRQIILIGGVAPKAIVIRFDPAKNQLSNLLAFHRNAVKAINQLLFEGCKKTFHPRIVKTAMCASHTLTNGFMLSEQRTVFLAGVLAAMIRMKNQTGLITIAGNCIAKRITA